MKKSPQIFERLVLGCIDSYDGEKRRILQHFLRSTRVAFLFTAQIFLFFRALPFERSPRKDQDCLAGVQFSSGDFSSVQWTCVWLSIVLHILYSGFRRVFVLSCDHFPIYQFSGDLFGIQFSSGLYLAIWLSSNSDFNA